MTINFSQVSELFSPLAPDEHGICLYEKARRGFSKAASTCLSERSEGVFEAARNPEHRNKLCRKSSESRASGETNFIPVQLWSPGSL